MEIQTPLNLEIDSAERLGRWYLVTREKIIPATLTAAIQAESQEQLF